MTDTVDLTKQNGSHPADSETTNFLSVSAQTPGAGGSTGEAAVTDADSLRERPTLADVRARVSRVAIASGHRYTASAVGLAIAIGFTLYYVGVLRMKSATSSHLPLFALVGLQLILVAATVAIAAKHAHPTSRDLEDAHHHLTIANARAKGHGEAMAAAAQAIEIARGRIDSTTYGATRLVAAVPLHAAAVSAAFFQGYMSAHEPHGEVLARLRDDDGLLNPERFLKAGLREKAFDLPRFSIDGFVRERRAIERAYRPEPPAILQTGTDEPETSSESDGQGPGHVSEGSDRAWELASRPRSRGNQPKGLEIVEYGSGDVPDDEVDE